VLAAALYLLEIFIGFIQAFIFTLLTALFVNMAAHPEH
jgi:F0F1-type ATP synthase membrane subunit a